MTKWINFAEIRQRVSLEQVMFELYGLTTLKRDGNKLIGPCPIHNGDSPRAFHADLSKGIWHCFTKCGKGGNQLDFVAAKEGITIREAALKLHAFFFDRGTGEEKSRVGGDGAQGSDVAAPRPPSTETTTPAPPVAPTISIAPARRSSTDAKPTAAPAKNRPLNLVLDLKPDHPHLTAERGLALATIERFGVGYCGRGTLRGTIAIPIHDEDGVLVAYAGRQLNQEAIKEHGKYRFPKGFRKDLVLYNFHRAKESMEQNGLILVESFFSVLKLYEYGFGNVVAVMGCELSQHQAELACRGKEVILLFDGDEAGWKGAEAAREKLESKTLVRFIRLPPGAKPDTLPARTIRWLVNGVRSLDLGTVSFSLRLNT